jgi:hypothetical protein
MVPLRNFARKAHGQKARQYFRDSSMALELDSGLLFRNSYFERCHRTLRRHLEEPHAIGQRGPSASFFDLEIWPIRTPSMEQGSEFYRGDFTALVSVVDSCADIPAVKKPKTISSPPNSRSVVGTTLKSWAFAKPALARYCSCWQHLS